MQETGGGREDTEDPLKVAVLMDTHTKIPQRYHCVPEFRMLWSKEASGIGMDVSDPRWMAPMQLLR